MDEIRTSGRTSDPRQLAEKAATSSRYRIRAEHFRIYTIRHLVVVMMKENGHSLDSTPSWLRRKKLHPCAILQPKATDMSDREHQLHPLTEDAGFQALRVVSGGMADEEYQRNGGVKCPYCRAEDACYHDDFYIKDIPIKDGTELHASTCDKCSSSWFDVVDSSTGNLLGTRSKDFDDNPLPALTTKE